MAKKRPRAARRHCAGKSRPPRSRMEPKYWRDRMFRNSFTYKGNRFQVSHWSVKIQHLGIRKTFSLQGTVRTEAAAEACQLYKTIVTRGWESAPARGKSKGTESHAASGTLAAPGETGFDSSYWSQRLIHSKYTE